jgi:RNA polymerase sigma factor (sigma-70 family)
MPAAIATMAALAAAMALRSMSVDVFGGAPPFGGRHVWKRIARVPGFATTRWSLILDARAGPETARNALEEICRDYRGPVLAYVRRHGHSPADAEDLTQEFFARFLERRWHASADPARGRFRSFLLTALSRFLMNAHSTASAQKRGGGKQAADFEQAIATLASPSAESPEQAFTRDWMQTVLARALDRLRDEAAAANKAELFERLAIYIADPPDASVYKSLGSELGMRANTLAVNVHRLRLRLRSLVRAELLQTVGDPDALEDEMRELRASLTLDVSAD